MTISEYNIVFCLDLYQQNRSDINQDNLSIIILDQKKDLQHIFQSTPIQHTIKIPKPINHLLASH